MAAWDTKARKCTSAKCLTGGPKGPAWEWTPRITAHSRTAGKGDLTFEVWIPMEIASETVGRIFRHLGKTALWVGHPLQLSTP